MAADATGGTHVAWRRMLQRLQGSRPGAQLAPAWPGAQFASGDPRLAALLPAAPRAAAVLVGLIEQQGDAHGIFLIVRAAGLRQHAGQIAFPGGLIEPGDADAAAAALREAQEEVGLARAEVLGYLPDQQVLTGFRITPVVARLPADFTPRLAGAEVQASFILPFAALLDPATEVAGRRTVGGIEVAVRDLQFGEHRIWGATAGMLLQLRALALP
ncbi:MAG TPA: CoA pyrophosphatase [Steroidobacteraceae bacterium]|nr:CoA pyrophosphatase [Steroidobacteraceae bacterium]